MIDDTNKISLRAAAIITGCSLLVMSVVAPFAEVYVYPKLVITNDAALTAKNIVEHKALFVSGIFSYLVTFIGDVLVTWALYILLRPVNKYLSLLAALFRFIFAIIAITALLNLITVFRLLTDAEYATLFAPGQLYTQVLFCLKTFRSEFHFGILFFALHLCLDGYLIFKSSYIPTVFGILVIISGLGYFLSTIQPYVFPGLNLSFAIYTYFGELIFMLWLLVKGYKIKETGLPQL